jgi:hypothetical protein
MIDGAGIEHQTFEENLISKINKEASFMAEKQVTQPNS